MGGAAPLCARAKGADVAKSEMMRANDVKLGSVMADELTTAYTSTGPDSRL